MSMVLPRKLVDITISRPPNVPFDINSPYLSKKDIYYYGDWWEEFFIPISSLPYFLEGQAERDGIQHFSISKSRPIGKQNKDDGTDADAFLDVGQSEEAGDRLATTARKEVRM
jgi:hypothetical protein